MAPRKPTPAQMRDRRARIAAGVLGCVLLAVGGIQGPKLLKALSGSSGSPSANAVQTTESTTTGGTVSSTPGSVFATTPSSSAGQIDGFGSFSAQDPFRSQMPTATGTTGATGTTAAPGATKKAATTPATTTQAATTAQTTTTKTTTTAATQPPVPPVTFTTTTAAPTGVAAAVLEINGKRALVGVGGMFPVKTPLFRFASLTAKHLRIGVVGGSFADGRTFVVLQAGREVTLLNQSDGTRFMIRFVHMTHAPLDTLTSPGPTAGATPPAGFQPGATATTPPQTTTAG